MPTSTSCFGVMRLGEFGPAPIVGRTLVILCAYRGGVGQRKPWGCPGKGNRLGRLFAAGIDLVTLHRLRNFVAQMRDHYANPRSFAVQVGIAQAALATGQPKSVRCLVDAPLVAGTLEPLPFDANPEMVVLAEGLPPLAEVDTVLLVYPDPLGLGFEALERRIIAAGVRHAAVANGRRRLFPLTEHSRRALRWRRFLAETRLVEMAAGIVVVPLAALLAIFDRVRMVSK